MTLGRPEILRYWRASHQMTQTEAAAPMGYDLRTWQKKEAGDIRIRDGELLAIAAHCNGIRTVEDAVRVIEAASNARRLGDRKC